MGIQGINASAISVEVLGLNNQTKAVSGLLTKAKWLAGASILAASTAANAAPALIINNVGAPTVVGSGQGKRAIWTNGGTVGGQPVDIVAVITTATLNHNLSTTSSRPQVTSAGQDKMFVEWRLYQAGTYVIATGTGGVPVNADVHVQFNDVDGPANEEVYLPVCSGAVKWLRIDSTATTGRAFGTVSGQADTFSLIGDKNYNNEPVSGVEALYPDTSSFSMGHTGNNGFLVRLDNPSYTVFQTFDYQCADFTPPVAVDDSKEGISGSLTIINILNNDTIAKNNNNGPNNNSQLPSEFAMQSVSLVAPSGATGVTTDVKGRITGFGVPGEGTWAYNGTTGELTFTPEPSFKGYATNIDYTFTNALGIASNAAKVTVWYPAVGVTKSSVFNDTNGDGFGQVGETIDYIYQVKSYGAEALQNVSVTETGFTGAGTLPLPTYDSGDANSDNKLDLTETWVYKASYALVAADLTAGNVANSATGTGQTAAGTTVSDTSDSSNPADGTGTSGPGPNNGDPTRTPLARAPISASNDSQVGTISAGAGTANAFNVFGNDFLKGVTATPSTATLSVVTPASNAGVVLNPATGIVSVAAGVPAGTYAIEYKICETGNPTNCATATATVVVSTASSVVPNICMLATRIELNGGFENPVFTPPTPDYHLIADASVPGWSTNDSLGQIEIWDSGFLGVPSDSDDQFAELNANSAGTLVQTGNVNSRAELIVSWAHRARGGVDVATAMIGDNVGTSVSAGNFSADTSAWVPHSQTVITGPSATQFNMAFSAVSSGSANNAIGNFLDSVAACQTYVTSNNVITTQTDTDGDGRPSAGDTITFQQTISNPAGNLRPLTGVTIDDTLTGNGTAVTPVSGDTNNNGVLDPGESWTFNVVYTITAADIAAGQVVTTSHANGNTGANIIRSDDVTITTPFPVIATADSQTGTIFSGAGQSNAYNVFDNDLLRGAAPTVSNVTLSVVTPASNPGVTLDTATGLVSVAPGTPAGTYTIDYKICETANPTNCASATATVVVTASAPITAATDASAPVDSLTGGTNVINALTNDRLNGVIVAIGDVDLTVTTPASNPGVTLDTATGNVSVAPGTPAGTYTIGYKICEKANPTNCATSTITVVVRSVLAASDDSGAPVNGVAGNPSAFNAFANDTINGNPVVAGNLNTTITAPATPLAPGKPVPVLDPATGNVAVPAGTPAGDYTIGYQICENADPTNCKTATITVKVVAAPIAATNDTAGPVTSLSGGANLVNAFANDTLNGVAIVPGTVTATITAPASNPGVTLDPVTGQVSVTPGTPAGNYTIDYKICEDLNPTNCANAQISVTVQASPIAASNDSPTAVSGLSGAPSIINAFANDTLGGVAVDPAKITASVTTPASNPGVTLDTATGLVAVAPGTPAGTYTIDYKICETANPTNCGNASVTVIVTAATIAATNDTTPTVTTTTGGSNLVNALANDTLNGVAFILANINLRVTSPASNPGVTLDPATGQVSVAPGIPAGNYSIGYEVCERLNPTNCATATVAVVVAATPLAATNDAPTPVNGLNGNPNAINAFANDTLNGAPVDPAQINTTILTPASNPGVVLDPATGNVSVAANTPAGTYIIEYQICEKLNPTNCKTATVTIVVTAAPITAAVDAPSPVNGTAGGNDIINALANDTLNGAPVNIANITLSVTTPASNPGVVLDPATGLVDVAAGTPAGTYTIGYQICERLNSTNCATSVVTVVVTAAPIAATPDTPPAVNGTIGNPAVVNAFANDTLNGAPVDPARITATVTTPASNPGVVLDPATGNVSVAAGTPAGSYTITYQICERLNPTNCATSTVTVVVTAAPIAATLDTAPPVGGIAGGRDLVNVLVNDSLNGQPVVLANIALTVTSPATNPGVTLDPATGLVSVAPDTPAGTYSIGYQICERLNPTNCATATVAVVVNAAPISASVDAPPAVSGANGNPNVINAFANDTLNGAPVNPAVITATVTTPASNPGVALNPATGIVSVAPGTPAGTYTIGYQICETLNPTNCATSTVTVVVQPPVIAAANDTPPPVRSGIANPSVINAFANDTLNGQPVNPALITASIITPAANPGVVLDPATGNVSVAAIVPAGTYTITYQICETLNPTNCQTASVSVVVDPPISAVTGTVYTDGNGNDRLDSGEARRPGWIVEIVKDGVVVGRALTDVNGEYRVEGLTPGTGYTIMFRNPENNVVYDRITNLTLGANTTVVDQNQPIDPSGVIYDSITRAPISGVTARLTTATGTPLPTACFVDASQASQTTGASGGYRFDLVPGAAPECPAGETVYRIAVSPPAGYAPNSALLLPQTGPLDPTGLGNPVRVSPDATPPTIAAPTYYLDFRLAAGDPDIINNHIAIDALRNLTPLIVTKTSIKRSASVGDVVPYEITVRNAENIVRNNVDVVDILPAGMKYVMGTASVNGTPQEPVKTDRQVAWKGQVIPANGSVRYNLTLVVGAGVTGGEKVNTGLAQNGADGSPISNRGTAVVTITPNAVFDCSELLGKVFEDANRNGYQDANEPGVPGVRLATVNGQLITTDEYGRYHIACAAVPDARIGSNFVLKVDTRTLPLGWDTTTDNPRSIRLTRGKFGELNFGVAPKEDSSASPGDLSKNRNEKGE